LSISCGVGEFQRLARQIINFFRRNMSCVWLSFEGDMHPMLHPREDELNVLAVAKASPLHDVAPVQSGRSQ